MSRSTRLQAVCANAFLMALSLACTLLVLEGGAWLWLTRWATDEQFTRYASFRQLEQRGAANPWENRKYSPHRYLGYYPTPNWSNKNNRHNAFGFRGEEFVQPKPANEFRIVCLGGSTTYTSYLYDYRDSYPALLQAELRRRGHSNVTVINAGAEGWSSHESFVNLGLRVLELDPDCIIVYHGINDVHSRLVWPPDAYSGDNRGWKHPIVQDMFMPPWYEYSTLIRILLVASGQRLPQSALSQTINPRAPTSYELAYRQQMRDGTYPEGFFTEVSAADMFAANPPVVFRRNLANMARLARDSGVETVLATFAYSPDFPDEPVVAGKEYQQAYAEMNDVVRAVAAEEGAHLFDFAAAFPADRDYFVDGRHVNEAGCTLKATLFADFVEASGVLAESPGR